MRGASRRRVWGALSTRGTPAAPPELRACQPCLSVMDSRGLRLLPNPSLPPLLAATLVYAAVAAAAAAATKPGRGENCWIAFQGRGECALGLMCIFDGLGAVCQDPLNEGDACSNFSSARGLSGCSYGLRCVKNECVSAKSVGDACSIEAECGVSARCGENSGGPECIELAGVGEKCLSHRDCAANLACVGDGDTLTYGNCVAKVGKGSSCDVDPTCDFGLRCLGGSCQALSGVGESCELWHQCAGDLYCNSKKCVERESALSSVETAEEDVDGKTADSDTEEVPRVLDDADGGDDIVGC